ncbi:hypothetical protein ACROYT_G017377 [Oculina patagonica]
MICLENLSEPGVCVKKDIPLRLVADPGYVHVQVANEEVCDLYRKQRYISKRGNLKPDVPLERFKVLIEEALQKRRPSTNLVCMSLSTLTLAEGIVLKSICENPELMHKVALKILKVLRKENEDDLCLFEDPEDEEASYHVTWVFH